MKRILEAVILALAVSVAGPALGAPAALAQSAPAVQTVVAEQPGAGEPFVGAAATPSPTETSSTSPANAGTGETAEAEENRVDYAPWVIVGVVLLLLAVILILRRRRNTSTR